MTRPDCRNREGLALLTQRVGCRSGPLAPLFGVGPRLGSVLGAASGLGLLRLAFELLGAGPELVCARLRLGIDSAGRGVADLLLDRAKPSLQVRAAFARYLANRVPLVAYGAQRRARGAQISGVELLGLGEKGRLGLGVGAKLRVAISSGCFAGGEKLVLRGLEPMPQRVVDVPGGPTRRFPFRQQITERRGGGTPVMESHSSSARTHSDSLACFAPTRSLSSSAKCAPRRLLNVSRAAE